ncbi:MAG TPA: DUF2905 domain-containing protein [Candidatus Dormibacteraeota bacterium]|jgi:hypothetical protein|nr:DUF2905 domain-containing protein [Candidatus Dormibacteraeota bacterium]
MPDDTGFLGRMLMLVGGLIALAGLVMVVGGRLPLGRLPGDISGSRGGVTFYFPLGTSLLLSVVLTLVLNLLVRR